MIGPKPERGQKQPHEVALGNFPNIFLSLIAPWLRKEDPNPLIIIAPEDDQRARTAKNLGLVALKKDVNRGLEIYIENEKLNKLPQGVKIQYLEYNHPKLVATFSQYYHEFNKTVIFYIFSPPIFYCSENIKQRNYFLYVDKNGQGYFHEAVWNIYLGETSEGPLIFTFKAQYRCKFAYKKEFGEEPQVAEVVEFSVSDENLAAMLKGNLRKEEFLSSLLIAKAEALIKEADGSLGDIKRMSINQLRKEIAKFTLKLEKVDQIIDHLKLVIEELNTQIADLKKKTKELELKIKELKKKIASLMEQNSSSVNQEDLTIQVIDKNNVTLKNKINANLQRLEKELDFREKLNRYSIIAMILDVLTSSIFLYFLGWAIPIPILLSLVIRYRDEVPPEFFTIEPEFPPNSFNGP